MHSASILARVIIDDLMLPDSTKVELIVHKGRLNWRQQNTSTNDKIRNLRTGLAQPGPMSGQLHSINHLDKTLHLMNSRIAESDAISATSRVFDADGGFIGHLAIMNLHTDAIDDLDLLISVLRETTGGMPGYLLTSGRYYHYYGSELLTERQWLKFLAQFLMPCILVSPRYIGHSLFSGFCSVRLTPANPHKPVTPTLVTTV